METKNKLISRNKENSRKWKHQNGGSLKLVSKHLHGGYVAKFLNPAGPIEKGRPAFYVNFDRLLKVDKPLTSAVAKGLNLKHAGFVYIKDDGTPVFKEFGIKSQTEEGKTTFWGDRVDLSNAPKYKEGQDPQEYMNLLYRHLGGASSDAGANVVVIPNADSKKIEQFISEVDDSRYQTTNFCGKGLNCATVAYRTLVNGANDETSEQGIGAWLDKVGSRIFPDGEEYADRLRQRGYQSFHVDNYSDPAYRLRIEDETREKGLAAFRNQSQADASFVGILDKSPFIPLSFIQKNGHTCIYNGTKAFYPNHPIAKNTSIVEEPEKHGWREINQDEVKPGDAIVLHNSKGEPVHFTIFDGVTPENTLPYYYMNDANRTDNAKGKQPRMVQPGDTLLIYSTGTPGGGPIRQKAPLFRYEKQYNTGGDYEGPRKYFRATGLISK